MNKSIDFIFAIEDTVKWILPYYQLYLQSMKLCFNKGELTLLFNNFYQISYLGKSIQ